MIKTVAIGMCLLLSLSLAMGRTFTDTQGRAVEAEVLGLEGDTVMLSVKGKPVKLPIAQLSVDDQAYLKEWALNPPPPRIHVALFEREGMRKSSPPANQGGAPFAPERLDTNFGRDKTQKEEHQHFQIDLTNQSLHASGPLTVRYKLYVRQNNGEYREQAGQIQSNPIAPGKREVHHSDSISTRDTKTVTRSTFTETTYDRNAPGGFTTDTKYRKSTSRTNESFGGIWVVVYQNGQQVGEAKSMTDDLKKTALSQP